MTTIVLTDGGLYDAVYIAFFKGCKAISLEMSADFEWPSEAVRLDDTEVHKPAHHRGYYNLNTGTGWPRRWLLRWLRA